MTTVTPITECQCAFCVSSRTSRTAELDAQLSYLGCVYGDGCPPSALTKRGRCDPCVAWSTAAGRSTPAPLLAQVKHEASVVDHPAHYGGKDNPYEAIKVIEAWGLGFNLGNAVKYISRAGKKGAELEDLRKAVWYINRQIEQRSK